MDAAASTVAQNILGSFPSAPVGWVQQYTGPSSSVTPEVFGYPLVEVRRLPKDHPTTQYGDPRIWFAVLPKSASADGSHTGFVVDIQAGSDHPGAGSVLWRDMESAARAAGISAVHLRAEDTGGWFWVKHGFELSTPGVDAPQLAERLSVRLHALAKVGAPVENVAECLNKSDAVGWLTENGLQGLRGVLPPIQVPRLDDQHEPTGTSGSLSAVLLHGSRWSGGLEL